MKLLNKTKGGSNDLIESFEKIQMNNFIFCAELSLRQNDTLVIKFDQDTWDLETASEIIQQIAKAYPRNNILTIFNGMELGVIHNED